jgi:Glycosyl hydrolases family 28
VPAEPYALSIAPARASTRPLRRLALLVVLAVTALCAAGASSALALDVSVLSAPYNATGNGTTNDRVAIQNAINAVNAAGGGTVNLPGTHTYLTGDLTLKTGVTLNINSGAILKQSQTIADYAHAPTKGREIPGSTVQFITYLDQNYPLIYAGNATNVGVTGAGTIQMTYNGTDANSIIVHAIGFHLVSTYTISNVTIAGASAYNITMRNTDHGTISGVTTTTPNTLNSDGISLMNSSYLSVHDNNLTTLDDGIYVWASYDDPRRSAWWNSDTPRSSHDIEVYNNNVNDIATNGSHGFLFINWTAAAPDQSLVEVSRINVHNNTFKATFPVAALNQDIYHSQNQKTPSKDLTFKSNVLTIVAGSTPTGTTSTGLDGMGTTGLTADNAAYNFAKATNTTGMYNTNFDGANAFSAEVGTSFWSTEGGASAPSTAVGQPGGRYGQINAFNNGYAGIYQGVDLAPGTYTFSASTQSSGAAIRFFAIQASTVSVVASTTYTNTTWQTKTISFTVTTAGTYRLGIDSAGAGSSATAYGRIDSTVLTKTS